MRKAAVLLGDFVDRLDAAADPDDAELITTGRRRDAFARSTLHARRAQRVLALGVGLAILWPGQSQLQLRPVHGVHPSSRAASGIPHRSVHAVVIGQDGAEDVSEALVGR
jgi:hypothetical protein